MSFKGIPLAPGWRWRAIILIFLVVVGPILLNMFFKFFFLDVHIALGVFVFFLLIAREPERFRYVCPICLTDVDRETSKCPKCGVTLSNRNILEYERQQEMLSKMWWNTFLTPAIPAAIFTLIIFIVLPSVLKSSRIFIELSGIPEWRMDIIARLRFNTFILLKMGMSTANGILWGAVATVLRFGF